MVRGGDFVVGCLIYYFRVLVYVLCFVFLCSFWFVYFYVRLMGGWDSQLEAGVFSLPLIESPIYG